MFARDESRMMDLKARKTNCRSALRALAGTSYPSTANLLPKSWASMACEENSLDAVSDRDFAISNSFPPLRW